MRMWAREVLGKLNGVRSGAALLWLLIGWASIFGCEPTDGQTSEALGPHFIGWIIIGTAAAVACLPVISRAEVPSWPRAIIIAACGAAALDVTLFYGVSICILRLRVSSIENSALYVPAAIATMGMTVLAVASWPALITAMAFAIFRRRSA